MPEAANPHKVTLVEDDQTTGVLMSSLLQMSGFAIDRCTNAAEAMRSLQRFGPDAMVLDLNLGDGPSGLDVLAAAREQQPDLPIMILSNYLSPQMVDGDYVGLPDDVPMMVKSNLLSAHSVVRVLEALINGQPIRPQDYRPTVPSGAKRITPTQASILRLVAQGMSDEEIAVERKTTKRAVQRVIQRALVQLGIPPNLDGSARVQAILEFEKSGIVVE